MAAELSLPPPVPYLAQRGVRVIGTVQAGVLCSSALPAPPSGGSFLWPGLAIAACRDVYATAANLLGGGGGGGSLPASASPPPQLRVSASAGAAMPIGQGAEVRLLCSKALQAHHEDRTEKWQLSMSIGIG